MYKPEIFIGNVDYRSPKNLQKLAEFEKCHYIRIAHNLQPALFAEARIGIGYFDDLEGSVTGLACKTNMSLTFVAMDSLQSYEFAERLGIDLNKRKDKTAVVIINPKVSASHKIIFYIYIPIHYLFNSIYCIFCL